MAASLEEFRARVQAARKAGVVHVALRGRSSSHHSTRDLRDEADTVAQAAGLRPLGSDWRALPSSAARAHLESLLSRDLAYSVTLMEADQAVALVDSFFELVGLGAHFWTNGDWPSGSWTPAMATFDSGIVAVGEERVGILWVEDED